MDRSITISPSSAHTNTSPTCVWDSAIDPWRILDPFFRLFFLSALLCTAWTIQVVVTSLPEKDFKEIIRILIPFLVVFQMQKECFSLPAIKATITLFLYTKGAKNISIWIYIKIYSCKWGRSARWNNTATKRHPLPWISWRKTLYRTTESCGTCSLTVLGRGKGLQTGGTTSMHAPIIYWTPSTKQSLPQYLLFNSVTPPQHSIIPKPMSLHLQYDELICIYFYNNLQKVKGDVLLDIIE